MVPLYLLSIAILYESHGWSPPESFGKLRKLQRAFSLLK